MVVVITCRPSETSSFARANIKFVLPPPPVRLITSYFPIVNASASFICNKCSPKAGLCSSDYISGRLKANDVYKAEKGMAIQYRGDGNNFIKGEEALINCLLLSKCNMLIKNSSFLSAWSKVFEPTLPVVMIYRDSPESQWFPERDLLVE